jgi:AraC-like DNA-binding protein
MYNLPVLEYLLCCIIVVILVTLYLGYKVGLNGFLDRLVFIAVAFMLVHIGHVFICQLFFPEQQYLDWAAPFGFMYGPFYYFSSFNSHSGKKLARKTVFWHMVPFAAAMSGFVIILSSTSFRTNYGEIYQQYLYIALSLSLIGYAVRGLLEKQDRGYWSEEKRLITVSGSIIFVAAIYFLIVTLTRIPPGAAKSYLYMRAGVYLIMLTVVCFTLRYYVNRLMQPWLMEMPATPQPVETDDTVPENTPQYQKSLLPDSLLNEYEQRLDQLIREKKSYLDAELSLQTLAKELKIPKHHLTQLFSVRIGKNFYQYINVFRVDHACELIRKSGTDTLEMLAFESGFNSKTTFNRYFKSQLGCTPSEYRDQQIER